MASFGGLSFGVVLNVLDEQIIDARAVDVDGDSERLLAVVEVNYHVEVAHQQVIRHLSVHKLQLWNDGVLDA